MDKLVSVRGMKDWDRQQSRLISYFTSQAEHLFNQAGFDKVYLPILEKTALFSRAVGEHTDIVEKEMYSFVDRNAESLSLRPEGTAGLVRAMIQNGWWQAGEIKRFQYCGSMFRRERPQRGRYRQFQQFGAETFGNVSPAIDAELINLSYQWFKKLNLDTHIRLEINCLGSSCERQDYRQALNDYLLPLKDQLDEDSQRRLNTNPLRILDSKSAATQQYLKTAPKLGDFLQQSSQQHFEQVLSLLDKLAIPYSINPHLVRGLDYYNLTVFEWKTDLLGSQDTICGGGRYDQLCSLLGGRQCPACGFAAGLERLLELYQQTQQPMTQSQKVYVVAQAELSQDAVWLAQRLRQRHSHLIVVCDVQFGSFKSQLKKADKSQATYAIIIADREWQQAKLVVKNLRPQTPTTSQQTLSLEELDSLLKQ